MARQTADLRDDSLRADRLLLEWPAQEEPAIREADRPTLRQQRRILTPSATRPVAQTGKDTL